MNSSWLHLVSSVRLCDLKVLGVPCSEVSFVSASLNVFCHIIS
jgi:hypothetical protein